MTDREKFQKTFDQLHASPTVLTEVLNMAAKENVVPVRKKHFISKAVVIAAAAVLIIGSCCAAYAFDLGGIQRNVQVWLHGEQTNAVFTVENGSYSLDYKDEAGNDVHREGGGVAIDLFGRERPLTADELSEEINVPEVEYYDDGTVWIYYLDQKMEITDKFENGFCFVELKEKGSTLYVTVKYKDGLAASPHAYIQPEEFGK